MKSAVTVSLVPSLRGGPWIFWDDLEESCRKAAALGFDGIELFTADAQAVDPAVLRELLATHHIALAGAGTGAGKVLHGLTLTNADVEKRVEACRFVEAMIQFAAPFMAPAIIGSMQGSVEPGEDRAEVLARLADSLRGLSEVAGRVGVPLIYEPLNRYETNLFNRLQDAVDFLIAENLDNVRLLADFFHMNIEEADPAASIRAAGDKVGHVHFADSNRRPVGGGHLDPVPLAAALRDTDYSGFVSAEAFSWPDADTAAKTTIDSFKRCMAAI